KPFRHLDGRGLDAYALEELLIPPFSRHPCNEEGPFQLYVLFGVHPCGKYGNLAVKVRSLHPAREQQYAFLQGKTHEVAQYPFDDAHSSACSHLSSPSCRGDMNEYIH